MYRLRLALLKRVLVLIDSLSKLFSLAMCIAAIVIVATVASMVTLLSEFSRVCIHLLKVGVGVSTLFIFLLVRCGATLFNVSSQEKERISFRSGG